MVVFDDGRALVAGSLEGVETDDELDTVRSIGFNVIQGWHYSPARSLDEILHMIAMQEAEESVTVPAAWRQHG